MNSSDAVNAVNAGLEQLTEQLSAVTEQLVQVQQRLDDFEAQLQGQPDMHLSTVHAGNGAKDGPEHRTYNPEAGP